MRKKIVLSTTSFSLFFTIIVASLYRNVITLIHLYVKIDIGRLTSSYLQRNNSFETEIAFIYIYIYHQLWKLSWTRQSYLFHWRSMFSFLSLEEKKKCIHTQMLSARGRVNSSPFQPIRGTCFVRRCLHDVQFYTRFEGAYDNRYRW